MDLSNIKVAFFDYDDTLCIHRVFESGWRGDDLYIRALVLNDEDWYINCKYCRPSSAVDKFAQLLEQNGIVNNVLTWSECNMLEAARRKFLEVNYEAVFNKIYIVGNREDKVKLISDFAVVLGLRREQILLIDDHPTTRGEFREAGFKTISVSEIMVMAENEEL